MTEEWFVGSNGNRFCDTGGHRYCLQQHAQRGFFFVVRDGVDKIASYLTEAEARELIENQTI